MNAPTISVVVPIYNEEAGLEALFARLYPALDGLGEGYELILIDDGSRDHSARMLRQQFDRRADVTRIILLAANFGQHMAIRAGFDLARGKLVITMDADLQNPPEEIPRLVAEMDAGHDVVATVRANRRDNFFRKAASRLVNRTTALMTGMRLNDYGCMLRGYHRDVVDVMTASDEVSTFIPALAQQYSRRPVEITVAHEERKAGESKYSLYRLVRLNFDLMTGFSVVPLQLFTLFVFFTALSGVGFGM